MNREKVPKSDRSRRPQPNVSRAPVRPPPQPPNSLQSQEPPSSGPTSIFGSLRRLKGGIATSTPKKPATFFADLEKKNEKKVFKEPANKASKKKSKKEDTAIVISETVARKVDNNGNITTEPAAVRDGVTRRRGKENVENAVIIIDDNKRPEYRRVVSSRPAGLSKDKVKSSTLSLQNLLRTQPKTTQNQTSKPKRPVTVAVPSNISVRRGHKEGQGHPDNLSRTSSITNLDSLEANLQGQQGKGAKPRKAASKERIDKQGQDGKKVTKNNNKLEPPLPPTGQPLSYSSDSLQEVELHQLRKQLREMADEKSSLALQLGEQRGQLNVLQKEILKLKSFQEESNLEMEKLAEENTALRNRLRDVAHSPLSDNEKQQLLFESRHHSSAPASIATNVADDNGGDATTCTTPDWDKHSSGNVSEVSVACLQDKINQMQETHYSTNEELQATLQELTDLQRQLTELQQENERLNEEKTLMFDSLCRQTERLNDSRQEVENLKQYLYRDRSDETGINQFENVVEREQKLVELLRSAQEEREQLLLKLEQVQAELHDLRTGNIEKTENISQLNERVRTLECTLDAKHAEHKQLDQELAQAKDQCSGKQIEINRLSDLLENARTKINELEQDRALSDKSELDELLDNARKEKDQLESEVTYLKEQLARSKNEIEKLKEQVFVLQEECKVTRNNAKTTQSDLEYKCEKLMTEKNALGEQLQQFQEAVNEYQVQAQCHLEDKRQLSAVLSETQRNMSEAERKNLNLENELQELRKLRAEENDEWEKFQNDLLTSVRVANDFKTEAQQELQKIILENKTYRERVRLLEGQLEKLKGEKTSTATQTDIILTPQIITLARNLEPFLNNRLSLLEHSSRSSSHNPTSPSSPTSSMEKLFPILGRERKSKSKENLADISSYRGSDDGSRKRHKSKEVKERPRSSDRNKRNVAPLDEAKIVNKTSLKKSKSRDDLTLYSVEENKDVLNRNKSKGNLQGTSDVDNKDKGSKGFLKWTKSKENLNHDTDEENSSSKEKKGFLKKNKSQENLEQIPAIEKDNKHLDIPRKSKDSIESSSDSNKSDPKPEFFSKFIKKREKKPANRARISSHPKFMSVEEEMLLKSLDNWYHNIDQNLPDELLSEEDRAIKKLKTLYEDDLLKEKPVAHKPKENLAISKPLLNSVVSNPKLEQIFRDPKLPTVDPQVRESALEDACSLITEETDGADGPRFRIRNDEVFTNIGPPHLGIHKSRSVEDVNVFEEYRTESELAPVLYRSVETENLATEEHMAVRTITFNRMYSEIQPNDSVSNPRYSEKYRVPNELPKPNIYINYENLDEIVYNIPQDLPESKLTEEQKFAVKLKHALQEAEKATHKKIKKKKRSVRGLEISRPTPESVQKNWKLKEIIMNPGIKQAEQPSGGGQRQNIEWKRHSTDIISDLGSPHERSTKQGLAKPSSKSYEDISFTFIPENALNMYYGDQTLDSKFTLDSTSSSSSQSFTSAEFNLDTGNIVQKCDIQLQQAGTDNKEDLLYNETINKVKGKEKKHSKEDLAKLKQELSNQDGEDGHHPKIIEAREKYNSDIKEMLKRIEHDELRKSLRKQRLAASQDDVSIEEVVVRRRAVEEPAGSKHVHIRPAPALKEAFNDFVQHEKVFKITDCEKRLQIAEFEDNRRSIKISEAILDDNIQLADHSVEFIDQAADARSSQLRDDNKNLNSPLHVIGSPIHPIAQISWPVERKLVPENVSYQFHGTNPTETRRLEGNEPHIQKLVLENVDFQLPSVTYLPNDDPVEILNTNRPAETRDSTEINIVGQNEAQNKGQAQKVVLESVHYQIPFTSHFSHGSLVNTLSTQGPIETYDSAENSTEISIIAENEQQAQKVVLESVRYQLPSTRHVSHGCLVNTHRSVEAGDSTERSIYSISDNTGENELHDNQDAQKVVLEELGYQLPSTTDSSHDNLLYTLSPNRPVDEINDINGIEETKNSVQKLRIENVSYQITNSFSENNLVDISTPAENLNDFASQRLISENVSFQLPPPVSLSEENVNEALAVLDSVVDTAESRDNETYLQSENCDLEPLEVDRQQYRSYVVDEAVPQIAKVDEEHGCKQTLKENLYGVVSPLDLRYTYRTVVKEYKTKYPTEHEGERITEDSDHSDFEYHEDFINEFFEPPKGFDGPVIEEIQDEDNYDQKIDPNQHYPAGIVSPAEDEEVHIRKQSDNIAQIDKEMHDIMDRYLHTRASYLVKKIDDEIVDSEQKTNLKKYNNFEDLQEIGDKVNVVEENYIAKPAIIVEHDGNDSLDDVEDPLSLQDLQFIEEMKAKYASADTISTSSERSGEYLLIETEVDHLHVADVKAVLPRPKSTRFSRPLSEINENDLLLIKEISSRTLADDKEPAIEEIKRTDSNLDMREVKRESTDLNMAVPPLPASPVPKKPVDLWKHDEISFEQLISDKPDSNESSIIYSKVDVEETSVNPLIKNDETNKSVPESLIPIRKESHLTHLPPSLRPKKPSDLPLHQPASSHSYGNVVFRNKQRVQGFQEYKPPTSAAGEGLSSKRLSDLMFRETIFVPTTESPDSPSTLTYKQDSNFKESIFVSSPEPSSSINTTFGSKIPTWRHSSSKVVVPAANIESPDRTPSTGDSKYRSYKETIFVSKEPESHLSTQPGSHNFKSEVKVHLNKYSAIPQAETIAGKNRMPLEKGILDAKLSSYEPVYSNVEFVFKAKKSNLETVIVKKPLPLPRGSSFRSKEHLTGTTVEVANVTSRNDVFHNMTDSNENFSEINNKQEIVFEKPKILSNSNISSHGIIEKVPEDKEFLTTEKNVLSQEIIQVEESKAQTDILKKKDQELTKPEERQYGGEVAQLMDSLKMSEPSKESPLPNSSSESTISSTIKAGQPGTILEDDVEEVPRNSDQLLNSDLNLFQMDSQSSYDSYMELFKTQESKDFDSLRGKKPHGKGLAGFAYVEEILVEDEGSVSTDAFDDDIHNATPKIVDFVPLDDKTTPVFTKEATNYDTLERERTFHVLGQAAQISEVKSKEDVEDIKPEVLKVPDRKAGKEKSDLETSLEVLARNSSSFSKSSSKSQTNTSRTSFSQAKKLFEALAEANKDRPKSAINDRSPARVSVRDSRSLKQVTARSSKAGVDDSSDLPQPSKDGN